MLYVIYGKSASGKTELAKRVEKELNIKKVITTTTRPKRENEIENVDYNFITNEEFKSKKYSLVNHIEDRDWWYGIEQSELEQYISNKKHGVIVCDLQGILELKKLEKEKLENIMFIMISVNDKLLLSRAINSRDDLKEVCRRYLADRKEYENLFAESFADCIVCNNENFEDAFLKLVCYINMFDLSKISNTKFKWDPVD